MYVTARSVPEICKSAVLYNVAKIVYKWKKYDIIIKYGRN